MRRTVRVYFQCHLERAWIGTHAEEEIEGRAPGRDGSESSSDQGSYMYRISHVSTNG